MKRYMIFVFGLSIIILGCAKQKAPEPILAKVNNYEITLVEFQERFQNSPYAANDTLKSRKDFLDVLINQKLMLQQAQADGLDKNQDFLRSIERFWEQSLLTRVLERKSNEISGSIIVNNKEIEERYKILEQEGKADKPYDQMYGQIKWELTQGKGTDLMNKWLDELHSKSQIVVDYNLLNKK
jgi:hypothetical protein